MADGAWIIRHGRSACMTASRDPPSASCGASQGCKGRASRGCSLDGACALHRRGRSPSPHSLPARASRAWFSGLGGRDRRRRAFFARGPRLFSVPLRPIRESLCRLDGPWNALEAFRRTATRADPELRHQAQFARAPGGEQGARRRRWSAPSTGSAGFIRRAH